MTMTVMRKRRMNEKKRRGITLATIRERGQRIREEDYCDHEEKEKRKNYCDHERERKEEEPL